MILFETHSTSTENEAGVASGHHDPPLSKIGRHQALTLGERYRNTGLSVVCCSDLQRSYQTAEIAFPTLRESIVRDPRLRECDYGAHTGMPSQQLALQRLSFIRAPFPGGESFENVITRVQAFLRDEGRRPMLIIGHRATWYALEHLFTGASLDEVVGRDWKWQPGWRYLISA